MDEPRNSSPADPTAATPAVRDGAVVADPVAAPPAGRKVVSAALWRDVRDEGLPGGGGASRRTRSTARSISPWRRIVRTPRAAAGLGVAAAALLLWPFADWSWWPWAAGLGALVLLRLLRLDGVLRGWAWHVGGVVVVVGLMLITGPWAWALAASIGVLLAGLVQLPLWRLAAVGAVLCLVSGAGFALSQYRTAEQVAAAQAQTQLQNRGQLGAPRPTAVLPVLLTTIARGESGAACDNLLAAPIRATFAAAAGRPDCAAAVQVLAGRVTDPNVYADADAPPSTRRGDLYDVDACRLTWKGRPPAGPQLGHLTIGRAASGTTYVVTAFRPC